jgi:hypothetical protein
MAISIPPGPIHIPPPLPEQPVVGTSRSATGVSGSSNFGIGVQGVSSGEPWVEGSPPAADGVFGDGRNGVHGRSNSPTDSGVYGENTGSGTGVAGLTNGKSGPKGTVAGVWGVNQGAGAGVRGTSGGDGVLGEGVNGVHGRSNSPTDSGVYGENTGTGYGVAGASANGVGVLGQGGRLAGRFEGDVEVTGDIRLLNQDCAEDFEISREEQIEPGTVMVIDQEGALRRSQQAYDRRVAGVVSGAGDCRPGIILGRQQLQGNRMPVALVGKVHCKVDASYSPIEIGDLLTTSATPGCAMKADDHVKAFGAVIGKALCRLEAGLGLIPVLVALQ